jgi:NADH-quinone oxidoreductase subunit I
MLREFGQGMAVAFRHMLKKRYTVNYPEERRPQSPVFRGRHILHRYADGLEKCVGCALCAAACPSEAIYLEAAENTPETHFSPGERYAKRYEIHLLRCIFCGFCEEACPYDAITMGPQYELAKTNRLSTVIDKGVMLQDPKQGTGDWRHYEEYKGMDRGVGLKLSGGDAGSGAQKAQGGGASH